jgi:FlaA1/EpsC-like NDP-sugar epimerase
MNATLRKILMIAGRAFLDVLIVLLAYTTAFQLRLLNWQPDDEYRLALMGMALIYVIVGAIFGIYQRLWTHASLYETFVIIKTVGVATIVILIANFFWPGSTSRLSTLAIVMGSLFATIGFMVTRYHWRVFHQVVIRLHSHQDTFHRVLIIGAGEAGQLLARRIRESAHYRQYQLLGYLDDDPAKIGRVMLGMKVLGRCDEVAYWTGRMQADTLLIAIRNIERSRLRQIIAVSQQTPARVQISPDMLDFAEPLSIRDITLDDLIGRLPVAINAEECCHLFYGKRILVTGAGGSIGSELVRQLSMFNPANLLLLDNNETGLYDLSNELRWIAPEQQQMVVLCDVTNQQRVNEVFRKYQPEVVFHVAAYKHVPMLEEYVNAAITTNLWGTMTVSQAALEQGIERFIFVSTDKAVHPSSVMGMTKRLGELWVASLNEHPMNKTVFAAVRFGNVIGSRGSVVPLFWQQIDRGGPVTVTHREMTRFFMSIPEAASLIVQAAVYATRSDIFMLDMGDEVKISDLAARMIRLRGLRVGEDIQIVYTGVRPGEKLHEELSLVEEQRCKTPHPRIYRLQRELVRSVPEVLHVLYNELLHINTQTDDEVMRKLLHLYLQAAEEGYNSLAALEGHTPALKEPARVLIRQWVTSRTL